MNDEMNLEKLFNTIKIYKWLIIGLTFLSTLFMALNLYFTPSVYVSTTILEKTKEQKGIQADLLLSSFTMGASAKVAREIELLKTFSINNEALKKVNFQTRFYLHKHYKNIEIFENVPIEITNIEVFNQQILNREMILSSKNGGYTLELKTSLKDKLFNFFFSDSLFSIDSEKVYALNELIDLKYFRFMITQKSFITEPIHFMICGDNRKVYDKTISKNLTVVQLQEKTPLILISYQDTVPLRANAYIDALSQSFIEQSILLKNQQNNKIIAFIDEQLDAIRGTLKKSENKLENYQVLNKVIQPSIQAKSYIKELSNIEIKISENKLKKRLVDNLISVTKNSTSLDSIAPSLMELNDVASIQLVKTLQNLQMKEDEYTTEYTDEFPKLRSIRKQIYYIRQKILANIKNLKRNIISKSSSLYREKQSYEKKLDSLPTKEKKVVNIKRDYQVSSTMYNYLLKKKTENQLIVVGTLSDYRIIDVAHNSEKPIKPKRALLMIVAPLIGLLLGIILAVIFQGLNKKIMDRKDVEGLTDYSIYGIIPKIKKKFIGLEVFNAPHSPFTESYRSLRNNIQIKERHDRANIILVSSLIAGEGKSTTVANLSSVFQMAGYKSIVLSLDLRKPTLHTYFNLSNDVGISGYLKGDNSINEIIFTTKHENLHIIPSGPIPINPSELILSNRLKELIALLESQYDYIFIDTAPIGLVSDSIYLMKQADLNLIVLRENYAEKTFIQEMENILEKNRVENVGLILNASLSRNTNNAYGYGYGY